MSKKICGKGLITCVDVIDKIFDDILNLTDITEILLKKATPYMQLRKKPSLNSENSLKIAISFQLIKNGF